MIMHLLIVVNHLAVVVGLCTDDSKDSQNLEVRS